MASKKFSHLDKLAFLILLFEVRYYDFVLKTKLRIFKNKVRTKKTKVRILKYNLSLVRALT